MARNQLRIGTLNLQNLQLPNEPMYGLSKVYTAQEYKRKIEWLASLLVRMQPDIVGFQELWSPRCLLDVFKVAGLDGEFQLITTKPLNVVGRAISAAGAVRKEAGKADGIEWIKDFPSEVVLKKRKSSPPDPDYEMNVNIDHFSRPLLRFTVTPAKGRAITVFVGHLKSKLPMRLDKHEGDSARIKPHAAALGQILATIRRTAEGGALRVILNKLMRETDAPVVVMGDLNDAPNGVTTSIITGDPRYRLFAKGRAGSASLGLYSAAMLQDLRSFRDVVYTYIHQGKHDSLDHILVSQHFYDYSKKRVWSFRRMQVWNDHLDEREEKELARLYSDHAALVATFDYYPAK